MEKRADGADASVLFFLHSCANFLAVNAQIDKTLCYKHSSNITVLIALSISIVFKALDTVLITQCCAISTVLIAMLQDNLRCFGVNYDMSRITRFCAIS